MLKRIISLVLVFVMLPALLPGIQGDGNVASAINAMRLRNAAFAESLGAFGEDYDDIPEEEDALAPETPAAAEVPVETEEVLQEETVMPKPPFMTNEERTLELQEPPIPQPTVFSDEMREIRQQESVPAEVSAVRDGAMEAAKEAADDVVDDVSDLFKPEA